MSYTPRAGSVAEAAIKFIEKSGSARSADIARAIGAEQKNISSTLQPAIDNGVLVACDVVVPGSPPQKEYRIGGGMAAPKFRDFSVNPAKRPPRPESAPPAAATEAPAAQAGKREERNAALAKSLHVSQAVAAKISFPGGRRQRVLDLLKSASAPMSTGQIAEQLQIKPQSAIDVLTRAIKDGVADYTKEGHARFYFLIGAPGAPENDRSTAPESQQNAAKSQPAAAKRSQKIPRNIHEGTPASPLKHFRCGLYSGGALRLEGDIDQDGDSFTLDPDQTRDLVGYLHRQEVLQ